MTPIAFDLTIGMIILVSTLISYFRGIIKEFFTLAGLGLALFVSYSGGHMLIPGIGKWLGVPQEGSNEKAEKILNFLTPEVMANVISYGGTFLLILIIMILIGRLITHWVADAGVSVFDRLLGATFGFMRGFLLVFAVYALFSFLNIDQKKFPVWVKDSLGGYILQSTLNWSNEIFELNKMIEDRGDGIAIKINKIDLNKIGKKSDQDDEELKTERRNEEREEEMWNEEPEMPSETFLTPEEAMPLLP
ncbi:MAG: CvpA family protein [Alphaproteobacteria bacterium]|nr:CvpA family protein [Alphaproteobacteria bacterium]MCK5517909.1 CvpA family protein [Alphaproteobacteria bacterium]MCK5556476.1 CvpA family protein [Alphaproteobacteria bacterium]MCK5658367.1 CvpA family protein [Alphaproteobacteria bacterium]